MEYQFELDHVETKMGFAIVTGYSCLVFRRPVTWSDGDDTTCLPCVVDLRVKENRRGQGFGSQLILFMERLALEASYKQLFIAVEPRDNPRAFFLYQRLGFKPLQSEPYLKAWEFTDSGGTLHRGANWLVDMVKELIVLSPTSPGDCRPDAASRECCDRPAN